MQKTTHTLGPCWLGEESEDFGSHTPIHANEWGGIAQVVTEMADAGESGEGLANARLIAAAPELLEALRGIRESYFELAKIAGRTAGGTSDVNEWATIKMVDAIIAKATASEGETKDPFRPIKTSGFVR